MLIPLLLGCATVFVTMGIQIAAVVYMLQYLLKIAADADTRFSSKGKMTYVISMIMTMLFAGHLVQVAIWAVLFMTLREFSDFQIAFYHSMVNFASLGYGDIVMSPKWRLLGAVEACNGVLMFGLSAGTMLSVMNYLLTYHSRIKDQLAEFRRHQGEHE